MRYQGRIHQWKDAQGFGFVTPNGGGERAFVHIKAFEDRSRRPGDGDLIVYRVEKDAQGRLAAVDIVYPQRAGQAALSKANGWPLLLAPLCFALLGISVWLGRMPMLVLQVYGALSVLAFLLYWKDKAAAQGGRWRTREGTLHLCALLGGWPGALVAQKLLRHKTVKPAFQSAFKATVVLNVLLVAACLSPWGQPYLAQLSGREASVPGVQEAAWLAPATTPVTVSRFSCDGRTQCA
ncbi:cold shock and DUF1294 domain-containing protein [Craterilacuibacter sp. RT1T]|uniref:DUF1294 domain-containing protein n=1 Tax=Craterilacuibacter sp. RT1T TaxID=2942211 RepID=UPI0020BFB85A|nr:cold shock and DUF1294 domain-containing protein [Craterilacuibacter sp. RT1T]MCL6262928.1 cold shock and DUF1294 domain-containing protein [Craterilacuibacter sp. RT1T]